MILKKLYVILKVTTTCNLRCAYCYESGSQIKSMSEAVLLRCMDEITAISDDCTIILHGGEPTTCSKDRIKRFFEHGEVKRREGKRIHYDLQTNGFYIDQEWVEIFKKYHISAGFSVDGPAMLHDKYRVDRDGKGSHSAILKNLDIAGKEGIEKNCLCVVTRESLGDVSALYAFFEGLSVNSVDFLPCTTRRKKSSEPRDMTLTPEEYSRFILEFYNMWEANGRAYDIRSYNDFFELLNGNKPVSCHLLYPKICGWEVISVDPAGDVYPCDSFTGNKALLMGNIMTDGLEKIYASKKSRDFYEMANRIPEYCQSCRYLEYCFGGCLAHRYFRAGKLNDRSYYCEAYKKIFRVLKKQQIHNHADSVREGI